VKSPARTDSVSAPLSFGTSPDLAKDRQPTIDPFAAGGQTRNAFAPVRRDDAWRSIRTRRASTHRAWSSRYYRIDLATGNVFMDPPGKWLSFDTRTPKENDDRRLARCLPIVIDDEILRRIMIRWGVLAEDERLAKGKLLKQIRG
jgi:hypothetical protein